MLNKYHKPNRNPSSKVLTKLLDFSSSPPALSGTAVALTSNWSTVCGSRSGTEVHGLNTEEGEEQRDHDRRGGSEGEQETTLGEAVRSCRLEEQRTGPSLGFGDSLRGLRNGREGEAVNNAALCIFEIWKSKRCEERGRKRVLEFAL